MILAINSKKIADFWNKNLSKSRKIHGFGDNFHAEYLKQNEKSGFSSKSFIYEFRFFIYK